MQIFMFLCMIETANLKKEGRKKRFLLDILLFLTFGK